MMFKNKSSNKAVTLFLIGLVFFSLMVRLLFFFSFTRYGSNAWIPFDSEQYFQLINNICASNGFCFEPGIPQAYRLPGYPLFLAPLYVFFGLQGALVVQIVIASFVPLLIFYVSRSVLPQMWSVAIIAACVASIHPGFVLYSGMFATELLAVVMLLIFFILLFRALQGQASSLLCAGIALGVASLMRPVGHYVLALALALLLITCHEKLWRVATVCVGWLIVVMPWLARNYLLYGALFFHTLPGLHFLQYLAAPIVEQRDHCLYLKARSQVLAQWETAIRHEESVQQRALNEYEKCCCGQHLATTYVLQHPWLACKHVCRELFKTCAGLYSAIILLADNAAWPAYTASTSWWTKIQRFLIPQVKRPFLIPYIYLDILVTILSLVGLFLFVLAGAFDGALRAAVIQLLPFIVLFIGLTLAYGGARLRMPAEPLILISAVCGWCWLYKKIQMWCV